MDPTRLTDADLEGKDIPDLLGMLQNVTSYWEEIGTHLGLTENDRRIIEMDAPNDTRKRFRQMLYTCQKGGMSKSKLLEAIDKTVEIESKEREKLEKEIKQWTPRSQLSKPLL